MPATPSISGNSCYLTLGQAHRHEGATNRRSSRRISTLFLLSVRGGLDRITNVAGAGDALAGRLRESHRLP